MHEALTYITVCGAAFFVAGLTLVSGFGLGTLLLPAFALFFPLDVAVAATAVVHLANNVFKLGLVGRHASGQVLVPFVLFAVPAALAGAILLEHLSARPPLAEWMLGARACRITGIGLTLGALMVAFALIEFLPGFESWSVSPRLLWLGGAISGFFGGLSGHQGALRSAFFVRTGMSKEQFVGTSAAAAICIDAVRLCVYFSTFLAAKLGTLSASGGWPLVAAATLAAFIGSYIGARAIRKITLRTVKRLVAALLVLTGGLIGSGVI